jgi:hypothetical protein
MTKKQKIRVVTMPSDELLLSYTDSPRCHYRLILEQKKWEKDKIRRLEAKCSKPGFQSRYYTAALHYSPTKDKLIVVIEHMIYHIARYRDAIVERDWPLILSNLREMHDAQGALFTLDSHLNQALRGSSAAVRTKLRTAKEILAITRRVSGEYLSRERENPKKEHLWSLVMDERRNQNLPTRKRSWFYELLRENPIS